MNYEILSLETLRKLQDYKKLQKKHKKLKAAYDSLLKQLKKLEKN